MDVTVTLMTILILTNELTVCDAVHVKRAWTSVTRTERRSWIDSLQSCQMPLWSVNVLSFASSFHLSWLCNQCPRLVKGPKLKRIASGAVVSGRPSFSYNPLGPTWLETQNRTTVLLLVTRHVQAIFPQFKTQSNRHDCSMKLELSWTLCSEHLQHIRRLIMYWTGPPGCLPVPGTCQVGWLVRRPGGPPRQMLN